MTMTTEQQFRQVETKLDQLLADASEALKQQGFSITDLSARTYHYKNPYLSWSIQLVQEVKQNSMIERTTIILTFTEPVQIDSPTQIQITNQVEKFYPGNSSEFTEKTEYTITFEEAQTLGLIQALILKGILKIKI